MKFEMEIEVGEFELEVDIVIESRNRSGYSSRE